MAREGVEDKVRSGELARENVVLGDRLLRLGEASRRINESLDCGTFLVGVHFRDSPYRPGNEGRVSAGKWIECAGRGNLRRMHTAVGTLRRRLADEACKPAILFTEPRIGYRRAGADAREMNPPGSP